MTQGLTPPFTHQAFGTPKVLKITDINNNVKLFSYNDNVIISLKDNVVYVTEHQEGVERTVGYFNRDDFTSQGATLEDFYLDLNSKGLLKRDSIDNTPNNQQPTLPNDYIVEWSTAVSMGLVQNAGTKSYIWYAKDLSTTNEVVIQPDAETSPSDLFLTPPTSEVQLTFESTSVNDDAVGSGLQTLDIQGVNLAGALVSETISMSGTTPVQSVNSYFRLTYVGMAQHGSSNTNEGVITIRDANTAGVLYTVGEGDGQAALSYTPEAGKYLMNVQARVSSTSPYAEITMWLRYAAFDQGRRKVAVFQATPATVVVTPKVTGFLPAGIELFATVKHTKPLAPGETYSVYLNLETIEIAPSI